MKKELSNAQMYKIIKNDLIGIIEKDLKTANGNRDFDEISDRIKFLNFKAQKGQVIYQVKITDFKTNTYTIRQTGILCHDPLTQVDAEKDFDKEMQHSYINGFYNTVTRDKLTDLAHKVQDEVNGMLDSEKDYKPTKDFLEHVADLAGEAISKKFKVKFANGTYELNFLQLGAALMYAYNLHVNHNHWQGQDEYDPSSGWTISHYSDDYYVVKSNAAPLKDTYYGKPISFPHMEASFENDAYIRSNAETFVWLLDALNLDPDEVIEDDSVIKMAIDVPPEILKLKSNGVCGLDLLNDKYLYDLANALPDGTPKPAFKNIDISGTL